MHHPYPATTPPPAKTVREFATRYGVSPQTVHGWGRRGELKITRLGPTTLRILPEDEDRWLKTRRTVGPASLADPLTVAQVKARSEALAKITAKLAAPDGLHRLGLSRYLFRRLTELGIYGLRDLELHPRRYLLPTVLDGKSLRELRAALATHHGLELDDHGQLSPLNRVEAA